MDVDAPTYRLVVHDPLFGSLHLKPLPLREAMEVVLKAMAAGVRIERVPDAADPEK